MIISDSHKFIFFHVPKTAGSSLTCSLAPYSNNSAQFFPYYDLYIEEIQKSSKSNQKKISALVQKMFSNISKKSIANFYKQNPQYITWMHLPHFMLSPHPRIGTFDENEIEYSPILKNLKDNSEKYSDFCKFAIVRNSWDYAFSVFKNKVVIDTVARSWNEGLDWNNMVNELATRSNFLFFIKNLQTEYRTICSDFFFCANGNVTLDQQVYFCDKNMNSLADHILRFESLDEDLKKISSIINIDLSKMPRLNESSPKNSKINYVDFYDDEARDIVSRIFSRDIDRFNFKFGH